MSTAMSIAKTSTQLAAKIHTMSLIKRRALRACCTRVAKACFSGGLSGTGRAQPARMPGLRLIGLLHGLGVACALALVFAPPVRAASLQPQAAVHDAALQAVHDANLAAVNEYRLAAGDNIRILVFQNPDLTLDTRVSEAGTITYPLVGAIAIGGLPLAAAEERIARALKNGNFLKQPQVNIVLTAVQGNQVSVLGQVNRPGRFPLVTFNTRVSSLLASAGGIVSGVGAVPGGAERVVLVGTREGRPFRREIDVTALFGARPEDDIEVAAGDVLYVPPAPVFYVYGEVQRPGSFKLKPGMTVQQALADGGGLTPRGTRRGLRIDRRDASGRVVALEPGLDDAVQPDDVLIVRESLF